MSQCRIKSLHQLQIRVKPIRYHHESEWLQAKIWDLNILHSRWVIYIYFYVILTSQFYCCYRYRALWTSFFFIAVVLFFSKDSPYWNDFPGIVQFIFRFYRFTLTSGLERPSEWLSWIGQWVWISVKGTRQYWLGNIVVCVFTAQCWFVWKKGGTFLTRQSSLRSARTEVEMEADRWESILCDTTKFDSVITSLKHLSIKAISEGTMGTGYLAPLNIFLLSLVAVLSINEGKWTE